MADEKIERRIKFIKERVGDDVLRILQERGIDVNGALAQIVRGQVRIDDTIEQEKQSATIEGLPVENCMTSELVYYSSFGKGESSYKEELERRFRLLKLTPEQARQFVNMETSIIVRCKKLLPPTGLAYHYFLMDGVAIENLPFPADCLASETIVLIDDAESAYVRDHSWLSKPTWAAVCYILGEKENRWRPYDIELVRRLLQIDFEGWQIATFRRNENMILERLKWRYDDNLSWQENTVFKPPKTRKNAKKPQKQKHS